MTDIRHFVFLLLLTSFSHTAQAQNMCRNHKNSLAELWTLKDRGENVETIALASTCEARWWNAALSMQEREFPDLNCPPVGTVTDDVAASIFKNGVLNDVGAILLIKGEAHEESGDLTAAKAAFQACAVLVCARVWSPDGEFFWSSSEACESKLNQ